MVYVDSENGDGKPRLLDLIVKVESDPDADLSYLGRYTSNWQVGAVDRVEFGHAGRGEHRYFVAAMTNEEAGDPKYVETMYQRMEDARRGSWSPLLVEARAMLGVPLGGGVRLVVPVVTAIGGVESDSDEGFVREVAEDVLGEVCVALRVLGVSLPGQVSAKAEGYVLTGTVEVDVPQAV